MCVYTLSHLSDQDLLRSLTSLAERDRSNTALMLAHIAEVDARKLSLPAAYASMFAYCVRELRLSEDAAYKRIRAARAARRFPAIFDAVASGRLHLAGIVLLTPFLYAGNADELLKAAEHKTRAEIEQLLAERYPRTELLALEERLPAASAPVHVIESTCQLAPGPVGTHASAQTRLAAPQVTATPAQNASTAFHREPVAARIMPIAAERYALHLSMSRLTRDKLQYVGALLSHQIPSGDIVEVLDRALDLAIGQLERRKFASTSRPRRVRAAGSSTREGIGCMQGN